jgi:hypothetical protein
MRIDDIKHIVNSNIFDNSIKRSMIIKVIAADEKAIPDILAILNSERKENKELITDMNLELSRTHIYVDEFTESSKMAKERFNKGFIIDNISKFYIKYQGRISHCFNRFNP